MVICIRLKKGESRGEKGHAQTMMNGKANEVLNETPNMFLLTDPGEKRTREGTRICVGR